MSDDDVHSHPILLPHAPHPPNQAVGNAKIAGGSYMIEVPDETLLVSHHRPATAQPGPGHQLTSHARKMDNGAEPLGIFQRRREPRYFAIEDRVWIQWWCSGEFNGLSARLVNVSRNGAMIIVGVPLAEGQTLRMILEDTADAVFSDAAVLGATPARGGVFRTRLEFVSPCHEAFFEAAADGFEAWLGRHRSRPYF